MSAPKHSAGRFNLIPAPVQNAGRVAALAVLLALASCAPGARTGASGNHIPGTWRGAPAGAVMEGQDPYMGIAQSEYDAVVAASKNGYAQVMFLGTVTCSTTSGGTTEFVKPITHTEDGITTVTSLAQNVPAQGELGAFVAVLNDPDSHCTIDANNGSHAIDAADTETVVLNPANVHIGRKSGTDQPVSGSAVMIVGNQFADPTSSGTLKG